MPTQEEKVEKLNQINERLKEVLTFNIDNDLVRTEDLGNQLNFLECKNIFEKILAASNELNEGDIASLPFTKINAINNQLQNILLRFNEIKNFNPKTQSAQRENLMTEIRNLYEDFHTHVFDILNYFKLLKIKPSKIEAEVKNNLSTVLNASEEANKKLTEINEILSKTKQAAGKTGVAEYSKYFDIEAVDHEKRSTKWFKGVIAMSIVVGLLGVVLMIWIKKDLSTGEAIQYSIAKFIVLSAFFYALVWTTKNYNAHRHNYIINKHRANSLNSFETFVKSTEDPATKDAVLLQATQSIFSPQSSGYDGKDGDGDPSNKFIEILRHIEPKGK